MSSLHSSKGWTWDFRINRFSSYGAQVVDFKECSSVFFAKKLLTSNITQHRMAGQFHRKINLQHLVKPFYWLKFSRKTLILMTHWKQSPWQRWSTWTINTSSGKTDALNAALRVSSWLKKRFYDISIFFRCGTLCKNIVESRLIFSNIFNLLFIINPQLPGAQSGHRKSHSL